MTDQQPNLHRNDDGTLPAYAWPGGYPIIYVTADGGVLCPACANANDDEVVGQDIHYEGQPEICDECNVEIPSAYGDPDDVEPVVASTCNACGGPLVLLGHLGHIPHYRCRNCGVDHAG